MKPEHCLHDLFSDDPDPIAPAHVKELVTQDDALNLFRLRSNHLRKQHDRLSESKRYGLAVRHVANLRSRSNEFLHLVVQAAPWGDPPRLPQAAKAPHTDTDAAQTERHSCQENPGQERSPVGRSD